jgi:hypothetical protein
MGEERSEGEKGEEEGERERAAGAEEEVPEVPSPAVRPGEGRGEGWLREREASRAEPARCYEEKDQSSDQSSETIWGTSSIRSRIGWISSTRVWGIRNL